MIIEDVNKEPTLYQETHSEQRITRHWFQCFSNKQQSYHQTLIRSDSGLYILSPGCTLNVL